MVEGENHPCTSNVFATSETRARLMMFSKSGKQQLGGSDPWLSSKQFQVSWCTLQVRQLGGRIESP